MNLTIDKRKTDIIYVDRTNIHSAKNDEVLKLVNNNNNINSIDVYVNILAGAYNLNNIESKVLKYLITNIECKTSAICNIMSKCINKSNATIFRAIDKLRSKNLVYINQDGYIIVSNAIKVDNSINDIKFIVIEVNTKITSPNIII